jgi:hypothetical protein
LPGSGKSTYLDKCPLLEVVRTDDYWKLDEQGHKYFESSRDGLDWGYDVNLPSHVLTELWGQAYEDFMAALQTGASFAFEGIFATPFERCPIISIAHCFGYYVEVNGGDNENHMG